jgi:hypothetical protein
MLCPSKKVQADSSKRAGAKGEGVILERGMITEEETKQKDFK